MSDPDATHITIDEAHSNGRHVSVLRKILNIIGCLLIIPASYLATVQSLYPLTLDILIAIILGESNRFVNERRRMSLRAQASLSEKNGSDKEKSDLETQKPPPRLDCIAAVVGYREDPELFTRALESYKSARCQSFILVGIDGDDTEDQDMVDVFSQVYPDRSQFIHITEPLGEVAQRVRAQYVAKQVHEGLNINEQECDDVALRHCMQLARAILGQHHFLIGGLDGIRHLCLRQRHMHKKGIMFTTFVFALVIADILGIEFMWSSDSDTLVFEDTIEQTINAIAGDPTVGGASSGLTVHNAEDSAVTKLAATVYWNELYLTRSTPACAAASDCQSGPSTAFRLAALPSILVPWYMQTVFGKRMLVNEDRHLTTNLLVRGWGVVFVSDVLAATETPTTTTRWLRQQVRWARATHIESLLIPRVYAMTHPVSFYAAVRREVGPLVVALALLVYFFTSQQLLYFSSTDLCLRAIVTAVYNFLRNPDRLRTVSRLWILPGLVFYNVPLPAVHIWSLLTLTADTWGTAMRSSGELSKKDSTRKRWFETGFFVVWMGFIGGLVAKWAATQFHFSWGQRLAFILLSVLSTSFGAWKVTIAN